MASYHFHSEAAEEYLAATRYYLESASSLVAAAFVAEIEAAILAVVASPATWPVIDDPEIRRYLVRRFPYSIYYRWDAVRARVSIYAVMHLSRQPDYWRSRVERVDE